MVDQRQDRDRAAWPAAILARVTAALGELRGVARLSGMSRSRVWRARGATASLIVKAGARSTEVAFYTRVAVGLRHVGVATPRLYSAQRRGGEYWLILEDVPTPLRHGAGGLPDDRVVATLARLHSETRGRTFSTPAPDVLRWTPEATGDALGVVPSDARARLGPRLAIMQRHSERLATPWCWISGDPNPLNWGERDDGSAVLFDWELFRTGLPATDLAISIAGLGDVTTYAALADRYHALWPGDPRELPWDDVTLARDIALAKVASVVTVLAGYARGELRPPTGLIDRLYELVPPWIAGLV